MISAMPPAHPPSAHSPPNAGERREGLAFNLVRRVKCFVNNVQSALSSPGPSRWDGFSSLFTAIYDRTVRALNYASQYIDQMLPEYLTRVGACCIGGFIIGALSPVGPLWGTASGLLLATGWQLCIECNTNRAISPEPRFSG